MKKKNDNLPDLNDKGVKKFNAVFFSHFPHAGILCKNCSFVACVTPLYCKQQHQLAIKQTKAA